MVAKGTKGGGGFVPLGDQVPVHGSADSEVAAGITSDPKSLVCRTLTARAARGVFCRARQLAKS